MFAIRLVLVGLIWLGATPAFSLDIAITLDDAPRWDSHFDGDTRTNHILAQLDAVGNPQVAFFVNTERLNATTRPRLERYVAAGHVLANHTHDHPSINTTQTADYIASIRRAHAILEPLDGFEPWFRFPYLREGAGHDSRDRVRIALAELGYVNAYITINTYDWYLEKLFQDAMAAGDAVDLDALRDVYVQVMVDAVRFYDDLAQRTLGRSPKHVLLLHENDLAALFLAYLIRAYRAQGWRIIPPAEAFTDPIAAYQTESLFRHNPGRIGEIAFDRGVATTYEALWHKGCNEDHLVDLLNEAGAIEIRP